MKTAFRSAFTITLFTFISQFLLFISQSVAAAFFGATPDMDAFLAASTLPQYIISVLLGSLGFVFIPIFVEQKTKGGDQEVYRLTYNVINNFLPVLIIIAVGGIIFARPLLQLITPGLDPSTLDTATKAAILTWPNVLASGVFTILAAVYQAEKKFSWQAAVPMIGSAANVIMLSALAPVLGINSLAIATTGSMLLQAFLLLKIITQRGDYRFSINFKDLATLQILRLLFPLMAVAVLTKFTPVIDRYLASGLPEGSISHLNYAFKVVTLLSVLISVGGTTVLFPKMASDVHAGNVNALRETTSLGLRIMWLLVAPAITLGFVMALPVITVLFTRGEFSSSDALAVASILKIYLFALTAMCLGNVTSRGFYVLQDTKTLAILSTLEAFVYCIYTYYLTRWLGIDGIAIGYVIYFCISLSWQLLILRSKMKGTSGKLIVISFTKTTIAAIVACSVPYFVLPYLSSPLLQLVVGGISGCLAYVAMLQILQSGELKMVRGLLKVAN